MWFKNIRLYRFSKPWTLEQDALEKALESLRFRPCGRQEKHFTGWVPPLGQHSEQLTHTCGPATMICLLRQEKLLPATVINDKLAEKAQEIQNKEGRKLYRKERDQLKDDIIASLLPQAFTRNQKCYAFLAPEQGWIAIDTSSATRAELLLQSLRECVDSLPVIPVTTRQAPAEVMTDWIKQGQGNAPFTLGEECELVNPQEDHNVIRCKGQDLLTDEIQAHLQVGMRVRQLAVVWKENLSCVIDQDLAIKKLRFEDLVTSQANEADADDAAAQFDQDFAVMSLELLEFFKDLSSAFGGLQQPQTVSAAD
jgi:recombination associated protein RdgC